MSVNLTGLTSRGALGINPSPCTYTMHAESATSYIAERFGTEIYSGADYGAAVNACLGDAISEGIHCSIYTRAAPWDYLVSTQIAVGAAERETLYLYGEPIVGAWVWVNDNQRGVRLQSRLSGGYMFKIGSSAAPDTRVRVMLEGLQITSTHASHICRGLDIENTHGVFLRHVGFGGKFSGETVYMGTGIYCHLGRHYPLIAEDFRYYSEHASEPGILVASSVNSNIWHFRDFSIWCYGGGIPLHVTGTNQMRACNFIGGSGFTAKSDLSVPCVKFEDNNIKGINFIGHWFENGNYALDLSGMTAGGPINIIGCYKFAITNNYNNPQNIIINDQLYSSVDSAHHTQLIG